MSVDRSWANLVKLFYQSFALLANFYITAIKGSQKGCLQSETKHGEMRWAVVQFLKELFKKMDGWILSQVCTLCCLV